MRGLPVYVKLRPSFRWYSLHLPTQGWPGWVTAKALTLRLYSVWWENRDYRYTVQWSSVRRWRGTRSSACNVGTADVRTCIGL